MEDDEIDALCRALNDGVGAAVRRAVSFDWHRAALRVLFTHEGVRRDLAREALSSLPLVG